jgi:hypothetical protein
MTSSGRKRRYSKKGKKRSRVSKRVSKRRFRAAGRIGAVTTAGADAAAAVANQGPVAQRNQREQAIQLANRNATAVITNNMFANRPLPDDRSTVRPDDMFEELRQSLLQLNTDHRQNRIDGEELVTQQIELLTRKGQYFDPDYTSEDLIPTILRVPALVGKLTDTIGAPIVESLMRAIKETMICKRLIGVLLRAFNGRDVARNLVLNRAFQSIITDMTHA